MAGAAGVYNLAADMGGMGFIETNKALCMLSVLINTHMLMAARDERGRALLLLVVGLRLRRRARRPRPDVTALAEADAYPAMPEDGYGWEKLFSERMCRHFREDFGLATRVARYHNVYGPYGTYDGGREKAPAAICRKVAQAKLRRHRTRSRSGATASRRAASCTSTTACTASQLLTSSDVTEPINIGSSELVTINQLVSIVEEIAEIDVERRYKLDAPQGVRGRNSDNTLILERLGWEPSISLRDGMERTYRWIYDQMVASGRYDTVAASAAR